MKAIKLKDLSKVRLERVMNRSKGSDPSTSKVVSLILEDVRENGDKAVKKYTQKFTKAKLSKLLVSEDEIYDAYKKVDESLIKSLKQSIKNVSLFNWKQLANIKTSLTETEPGIKVWREFRVIERVGLYIPGGKALYPSSVVMTATPAKIAGCKEIIICTPPNQDGEIAPALLVAADLSGVDQIFKVGGAEAIAAMAFGTKSVPKVDKIFGPGNKYVAEAKTQVMNMVGIDMPAGPSEVFIIADESADPKFIAADLLADGEHSEDSACVLIATSEKIAKDTVSEIKSQLKNLPTGKRAARAVENFGLFAVVNSLEEAVNFCNEYAPEHLELLVDSPEQLLPKISNAGSVFLGKWTAKSAGDYLTGANHVLPTGKMAKVFGALSIEAFGKMIEFQKVGSQKALSQIRQSVETLSETEQLPAHKRSITIRFDDKL